MWIIFLKLFTLFYILLLTITYSNGWRAFNIDIIGYTYRLHDNETFEFCHFELLPFKKRHVINGTLSLKHEVRAYKLQVEFSLLRPQSEPFTMLNTTVDGCSFLESPFNKVNMMSIIHNASRNEGGYIPNKCPLMPHKTVNVHNFYFDPEKFPSYTVDTDFMCTMRMFTQGKEVLSAQLNGSIFTKNKRKSIPKKRG